MSKILSTLAGIFGHDQEPAKSPLAAAIELKDVKEIKRLLDSGADINATDKEGRTLLMLAAAIPENYDVVKLLIELGADILAEDAEGKTAVDHVFEPEEPPEHHENAYEAWIHCEEHYTRSYLSELSEKAKAAKISR